MHIHVMLPDGEAKFWLTPRVDCAENTGLSQTEIARLTSIVEERKEEIIDAWNRHFSG